MSVAILGPLHVVAGGRAIALTRPQAQLVLARLALSPGRVVQVDALIDTLWGDEPPDTARKILQKYVWELRRDLGASNVGTEPSGYVLLATQVDAVRFEELLDAARAARLQGRARRAWELLDEALGLWRGTALAGLPEVEFVADEARRLDELRLGALENQVEIGLALGKHEALVAPLEDLVGKHPLRERLWAALMTALYRSGRQGDALGAYRRLRSLLKEELGVDPSPDLAALEERILAHDTALRHTNPVDAPGNIPATYTSFVGRAEETARVEALLASERLVSIVGPGGAGKTRLALEVGSHIQSVKHDGVWFVDLSPLNDPALVPVVTAALLGVSPEPRVPLKRTLMDYLASKNLLLVLDNCEHVTSTAAWFASEILRSARGVDVLITSREPLGLTGEVLFRLDPLAVPRMEEAEADVLADVASVRLFVDRASAADPGFRLTDEVAPRVADICRKLEGIPLAIELAARQLHVIGPDELYESLVDRLAVLAAPGEPDARHRTMDAAIDWSFRMLDVQQRPFFTALSVFPGSFTADAAGRVCRHANIDLDDDPVGLLTALVSRSMVVRVAGAGPARYRLLQPIRSFARDRVADEGLDQGLYLAHARWVRDLLAENPELLGPDEERLIATLWKERHHLPAALKWAADHDPDLAAEILENAADLIQMEEYRMPWAGDIFSSLASGERGRRLTGIALANGAFALSDRLADYPTALRWAEAAIEAADASGDHRLIVRAKLAYGSAARSIGRLADARDVLTDVLAFIDVPGEERWAARTRHLLGLVELSFANYDRVIEVCSEAAELWKLVGSRWGQGKALWLIAAARAQRGDHDEAELCARRARELMEHYDNPSLLVHVRAVEGDAARFAGDLERAQEIYRECLTGFQAIGDRRCSASSLKNLGVVAFQLGRPDEAVHLLMAALDRRRRLGDETGFPECLEGLALAARQRHEASMAIALLAAASRIRAKTGVTAPALEQAVVEEITADLRASVSEDVFEAAWAEGLQLAIEDVFTFVNRLPSTATVTT